MFIIDNENNALHLFHCPILFDKTPWYTQLCQDTYKKFSTLFVIWNNTHGVLNNKKRYVNNDLEYYSCVKRFKVV